MINLVLVVYSTPLKIVLSIIVNQWTLSNLCYFLNFSEGNILFLAKKTLTTGLVFVKLTRIMIFMLAGFSSIKLKLTIMVSLIDLVKM